MLSRRVKPTSTTRPQGMKVVCTQKSAWGCLGWLYSKSPTAERVPDVLQRVTGRAVYTWFEQRILLSRERKKLLMQATAWTRLKATRASTAYAPWKLEGKFTIPLLGHSRRDKAAATGPGHQGSGIRGGCHCQERWGDSWGAGASAPRL